MTVSLTSEGRLDLIEAASYYEELSRFPPSRSAGIQYALEMVAFGGCVPRLHVPKKLNLIFAALEAFCRNRLK